MFSITRLLNNIRNDSIIDYMDLKNKKRKSNKVFDHEIIYSNKKQKLETSFDYIVDSGYKFEDKIIQEITEKMINNVKKLCILDKTNKTNVQLFEETRNAILENKYEIILNGLLIDYTYNIYGLPDLIVTGSWIHKYIGKHIPVLKDTYYIIDIKATTIPLNSCGKLVSFANKWEGYKMQVYIYSRILNQIQNKTVKIGFLMGNRYKYVFNKNQIIKKTFDTLGTIMFDERLNAEYKLLKSIEWNNLLEKTHESMKIEELQPNMKNKFDKNYYYKKYNLSKQQKEITLLWNCGVKQRESAQKYGISSYDDKNLTADKLGFKKNTFKYNIIDKMLKILHTDKNIIIPSKNNIQNWRKQLKNEYFIDFETFNTINSFGQTICVLYMIGIGFMDNNEYKHLTLMIDTNNFKYSNENIVKVKDEKQLLEFFISFVQLKKISRLIHWSHAETVIFNKKLKQYNLKSFNNKLWFDFLNVFKNKFNPIIIKECFSFGIKKIINKLYEYKMISLQWNEDMDNGFLSSIIACKIYENNYSMLDCNNKMNSIINYNTVDCQAMYELLTFIRSYKN